MVEAAETTKSTINNYFYDRSICDAMKKQKHLLWSIFYISVTGILLYTLVINWAVYESTYKMRLYVRILFCVLTTIQAISHFIKWRREETTVNN